MEYKRMVQVCDAFCYGRQPIEQLRQMLSDADNIMEVEADRFEGRHLFLMTPSASLKVKVGEYLVKDNKDNYSVWTEKEFRDNFQTTQTKIVLL